MYVILTGLLEIHKFLLGGYSRRQMRRLTKGQQHIEHLGSRHANDSIVVEYIPPDNIKCSKDARSFKE